MLGIKSSATPNIKMQKAGARRELLLLRFLAASDLGVGQYYERHISLFQLASRK